MLSKIKLGMAAATALLGASAANAAIFYTADLTPLNGKGRGAASLILNGDMLTVNIAASGLDKGPHLAHIHGLFTAANTPLDSHLPSLSDDTDGDGFVELAEALPDYGPIILNMNTIGTGSNITFSQTFDLTDPANFGFVNGDSSMGKYTMEDLVGSGGMQLDLREIIIHGQDAPAVGAGTSGEVDGTAGFKLVLPTLGGEIVPATPAVPEPATWAFLIVGFGAVGFSQRVRNRQLSFG